MSVLPNAADDILSSIRAARDLVRMLRDRDERADQIARALGAARVSAVLTAHPRDFGDVLAHLDDAADAVGTLDLGGDDA